MRAEMKDNTMKTTLLKRIAALLVLSKSTLRQIIKSRGLNQRKDHHKINQKGLFPEFL